MSLRLFVGDPFRRRLAEPSARLGDNAHRTDLSGQLMRARESKGIFVNQKVELTSVIQTLTVAEHLNFRRAAEALGVCQSSVSKRVIKLENLVGGDLFDRHHRSRK